MSNQQKTLSNIGTDCCREPRSWEIEIAMAIWLLVKIGVPKDRLHLEPSFGGVVVIRKNITVTMWICVKIWCLQNLFFEVIGQFGHFRRIPNLWRNTDQRCFLWVFVTQPTSSVASNWRLASAVTRAPHRWKVQATSPQVDDTVGRTAEYAGLMQ
jgi:hypothetical protein